MKVALVGGGNLGEQAAQSLRRIRGVEVTGVYDIRAEAAERLAELCRTEAFTCYEDLVAKTEADVVCVYLPTYIQKQYIMMAIEQGKHVICEAPLAATAAEAEHIMAAAAAKGVRLFAGHTGKFAPYLNNIKDKLTKGSIGQPGVVHIQHSGPSPVGYEDWYNDSAKSGGVIWQQLIHDIFLMRWMLGDVKTIYAMNRVVHGTEYASVTLRFRTGAIANITGHWGDPDAYRCRMELAGNNGVIRYDSRNTGSFELKKKRGPGHAVTVDSPMVHSPYYDQLEHFIGCLKFGTPSEITLEDAHQSLQLAEAALHSAETGMPAAWEGYSWKN
ncbi:Gfo/Idh/MocA family protein [Paenibacillus piri]|uniref:Gfo/Idh/MocA family oxidoreductase n=1 Tax=Paenibacillus piri TaxID=2547395 RepID=A0A4R5KPH4_9BACL|nr:Gfo/Idh/MocA family oxidoreductase [Paenibacillus piri]TDF97212.1 Gfo/Idh/MocA family oxidoreductase [Paenibacillus piri]